MKKKRPSTGWRVRKLGDIASVMPGFAFKSKDWCKEGIPVVKIKNIVGDLTVNVHDVDCVPTDLLTEKLQKFALDDGDILVAMTGATAGKVGRLRCRVIHLLNQRVAKFAPYDVDSRFFWAVVSSADYQGRFFKLADGAAQPNMSGSQIEKVEILVPDLTIQRKIASILSAYDDLIENNARRIAILEEMAQAIYREWFVEFRFLGHEKVKLVDSPLGKIPEEWRVGCFSTVATFVNGDRGKNYPKSNEFVSVGVPFINAGHLIDGSVDLENVNRITEEVFDRLGQGKIRAGDLLYCVRGSLGRLARVGTLDRGAIASSLVIIRESNSIKASYLYYKLSGDAGERVVAELNNGVAQPNISVESLKRYLLVIPPADIVSRFHDQIAPIWSLIHAIRRKSSSLRKTRELLLPRLICGQLDVDELDIETGEAVTE